MNYQRIYDSIIYNAKQLETDRIQLKKSKLGYFERHHIIPKCMEGDNSKENLVLLTAKEHYMAHRLLVEIYPENYKLRLSLIRMCTSSSNQSRYSISAKIYERIKIEYGIFRSELMSGTGNTFYGKKHTKESIEKIAEASKNRISGSKNYFYGSNRIGKLNPFFGKKHSIETRKIMSEKRKNNCKLKKD